MSMNIPASQGEIDESHNVLSDDEGNTTNYFIQRFMERSSTNNMQNHGFSPEQIDNAINLTREWEANRRLTMRSSKFTEENTQTKLPLKTKSAMSRTNLSLKFASPYLSLQNDNFKPTDYTYARSCTYRRSSPTEKDLSSPVLRRKGLYCRTHDGNYSYEPNLNLDETDYLTPGDYTITQHLHSSWYSRFWHWITNKTDRFRSYTHANGIPPQMRKQHSQLKRRTFTQVWNYLNAIFWFCKFWFWFCKFPSICSRTLSIVKFLILRSKSILFSGKSTSSSSSSSSASALAIVRNDKHSSVFVGNEIMDLVQNEIAVKEIRKIVTEETIIDEIAKEDTRPKRSAFLWPCFLCFLLPLLFLLPALFLASRSPENNSTLCDYTRLSELVNVKNFNFFQKPSTASLPPVEIRYVTDPELVKKFELQLSALQSRIAALEGANAGAVIDLENFQKKLNEIDVDNAALTLLADKIKLNMAEIADFRDKLLKLETDVIGNAEERKIWQDKLIALIADYDKRNEELNLLKDKIESLVKSTCNCSSLFITEGGTAGLKLEDVNALITAAITKYDADKTGLADYALEPAGGSVISIRCTETYYPYTRRISWWSLPFGYQDYSPRTVIQPGLAPGECWAFKGSRGYLVIQLSHPIRVTAVSYEHIPKSISPDGRIDSAPKQMEVYGLQKEIDPEPVFLGAFSYDDSKEPLQYFPVQSENSPIVPMIELRILGNHGHQIYTCMYRLRVHGQLVQKNN